MLALPTPISSPGLSAIPAAEGEEWTEDEIGTLLVPDSAAMSSIQYSEPYFAYDNNPSTFVHSLDNAPVGDPQWLEVFYNRVVTVSRVDLVLQRWASWCQENLVPCAGTWTRLWGLQVSVGYQDHPDSLKDCGEAVPEYPAPNLVADVVPDPIVKSVLCSVEMVGDRIRFLQTREGEKVMISEVQVYGEYQSSDDHEEGETMTLGTSLSKNKSCKKFKKLASMAQKFGLGAYQNKHFIALGYLGVKYKYIYICIK